MVSGGPGQHPESPTLELLLDNDKQKGDNSNDQPPTHESVSAEGMCSSKLLLLLCS